MTGRSGKRRLRPAFMAAPGVAAVEKRDNLRIPALSFAMVF